MALRSFSPMPQLLPPPLHQRRGIPFYHAKSEAEFSRDPYERYDQMVRRQTVLHFSQALGDAYPFRELWNWWRAELLKSPGGAVAEIGCGLARLLGEGAAQQPKRQFYGLDYSYQMLKWAKAYWVDGQTMAVGWPERGFPLQQLAGQRRGNLHLALAKAEALPFPEASLDLVYSSFLLDRVGDPGRALFEMQRVLRPGGVLLLASPLNFQQAQHWTDWAREGAITGQLRAWGMKEVHSYPTLALYEPLDPAGNQIQWICRRFRAVKG
ncbi:MAG: methyltransferase domain-containing protein [Bacteroidota bacterium]